jgi:hypothetical protein
VEGSSSDGAPERASRFDFRLPDVVNVVLIAIVLLYVLVRAWREKSFRLQTGSISAQASDLLWFALACGLLSFATIESVKRLTPLRAMYHERITRQWLQTRFERIRREPTDGSELKDRTESQTTESTDRTSPFQQLVAAMGIEPDDRRRVFNLPSEQLAAQISAAADLALTSEDDRYTNFLASVTKDERDLPSEDREPSSENAPPPERDEEDELRRAQQARIGLDQLQVALRDRWRRYLWGAGLWISGAYGIGLAFAGHRETIEGPRHVLAALVLGGVVAAVARDLTAIVERLRG